MNFNENKLNYMFNQINFKEQLINRQNSLFKNKFFKLKNNFYIKNVEKNKFLLITNLLLLERSTGQRVVFVSDTTDAPRVKPIKVGCSVSLRNENLFNFWKIFVYYSFPKLYDFIYNKNDKFENQNLIFLNLNYFLFISSFSFSNDFDKFLLFYEDYKYYLSVELYSGFHKFLLSKPLFSFYGLTIS